MPHTLQMPEVKEIFADVTSGNTWTSRTPWQICRTGIDRSIPISTPSYSGMIEYSTPDSSDNTGTRGTGTRIPIGITSPLYGLNMILEIDNIRKSATPDLIKSNKLDNSIDQEFRNNLVALPIFTEVICEKSLTVIYGISTPTVRWTTRQILLKPQHHNLCIWDSLPLTHWINVPVSGSSLP